MFRWFRAALIAVLMASALVAVAPGVQAVAIPETFAERVPVPAGAVAPAFAIDFVPITVVFAPGPAPTAFTAAAR